MSLPVPVPQRHIAQKYGRLVSVSINTPDLTVRRFLRHATGRKARFYWKNGRDPITFAGVGLAAELTAWGENRYDSIQQQAADLFADAFVTTADEPMARPRLFGGFAFRDDFVPDNTWSSFYPAHFALPHYQLLQRGRETWLTINAHLPLEENDPEHIAEIIPALREALETEYDILQRFPEPETKPATPEYKLRYPMDQTQWDEMITAATDQMGNPENPLTKVVLSRVCEMRTIHGDEIPVDDALDYLDQHYPACYRFLFEPRPSHAFYGATPELLAEVNGTRIHTMGLAGSERRGHTEEEDMTYGQTLLDSVKDRYEHDVVVQSLRQRLAPLTTELEMPDTPQLYKLSNIQHLYTPIRGLLHQKSGVLPLVQQLHPTPALGGTPRPLAMRFIEQHEPVTRGWYAAPIGWIDHQLDGSFGVAIRSAVAQDNRVWAYAGAGIVAKSVPEKEWAETALKFRPMLDALQIE